MSMQWRSLSCYRTITFPISFRGCKLAPATDGFERGEAVSEQFPCFGLWMMDRCRIRSVRNICICGNPSVSGSDANIYARS